MPNKTATLNYQTFDSYALPFFITGNEILFILQLRCLKNLYPFVFESLI